MVLHNLRLGTFSPLPPACSSLRLTPWNPTSFRQFFPTGSTLGLATSESDFLLFEPEARLCLAKFDSWEIFLSASSELGRGSESSLEMFKRSHWKDSDWVLDLRVGKKAFFLEISDRPIKLIMELEWGSLGFGSRTGIKSFLRLFGWFAWLFDFSSSLFDCSSSFFECLSLYFEFWSFICLVFWRFESVLECDSDFLSRETFLGSLILGCRLRFLIKVLTNRRKGSDKKRKKTFAKSQILSKNSASC